MHIPLFLFRRSNFLTPLPACLYDFCLVHNYSRSCINGENVPPNCRRSARTFGRALVQYPIVHMSSSPPRGLPRARLLARILHLYALSTVTVNILEQIFSIILITLRETERSKGNIITVRRGSPDPAERGRPKVSPRSCARRRPAVRWVARSGDRPQLEWSALRRNHFSLFARPRQSLIRKW